MGTTANQKKLFFSLRKAKSQINALEEGDLTPEHVREIAHRLGVPEHDVVDMNRRLSAPDSSLNAPVKNESDAEWQDWLTDDGLDQEAILAGSEELNERRELLSTALDELNEREREIIAARRLQDEPSTLEELSQKYGISRERVRQIEVRAFEKLQTQMKRTLAERRSHIRSSSATGTPAPSA